MLYIKMIISCLIFFSTNLVLAQATANFNASVTIIQPTEITTTSDLSFARIDAKNGGEVTLSPDNRRTASGSVELCDGGNISAASFKVTGESGYTYAVTLPNGNYELINGSGSIVINNFTTDAKSDHALVAGIQTIHVGATLNVNAAQNPGIYKSPGGFNVTVNYN